MTRRRWGLLALGIVLLGWIIGGEWVSIRQHVPENHFIDALGGLSFLVAGLVALERRPRNRMGWLMIAYVVVSYLGNWGNLQVAVVPMIGTLGQQLGGPILAQTVLSYPTGRLRTRFERFAIGTIYAVAIGVSVVILLAYDPRADGCTRCAWEPAAFPSRNAVLTALLVGQRAGIFLFLLFLAAVWLRWRRATPGERRDLAPLWVAVCIYALVGLMGAFASPDTTAQPFAYLMWELESVLQIGLPIVFLWGLLSTRLARSAVGDLVMELDKPLPPGELRACLARALGDPSLEVLYAREGLDGWVDADGQPGSLPEPAIGQWARTVTMVERDGRPLAALLHDPALDQGLVRAASAAAGMAIENERLQAEVRAQLEEVRASRQRIVEAGDRERRRVERDLHDGAQQRLLTLSLALHTARRQLAALGADADPALVETVRGASEELRLAIDELRELARGIHPAILTDEGLEPALASLAGRTAVPVTLLEVPSGRLPRPVEATAYFVVSEALANLTKHGHATSASVRVRLDDDQSGECLAEGQAGLLVEVRDDGVGGADPARGSGLRGLHDRVAAVGGRLSVTSPPGQGTVVQAWLPCCAAHTQGFHARGGAPAGG